MLVPIAVPPILLRYLGGVEETLAHHARHLQRVVPSLAWAVLSVLDSERWIEVHEQRSQGGEPEFAAAVWIGGVRYCIAYNRRRRCITLRQHSRVGPISAGFTDDTQPDDVRTVFASLPNLAVAAAGAV